MPDQEEVERFAVGDKVWVKEQEGEHEADADCLIEKFGFGTEFYVTEVLEATNFASFRFHPQVMYLRDCEGELVEMFHVQAVFPGHLFTKKKPAVSIAVLTEEEAKCAKGWVEAVNAIVEQLGEHPELVAIYEEAEKRGLVVGIRAMTSINRLVEVQKTNSGIIVPTVKNDGAVEFDPKDEEELGRIFRNQPKA